MSMLPSLKFHGTRWPATNFVDSKGCWKTLQMAGHSSYCGASASTSSPRVAPSRHITRAFGPRAAGRAQLPDVDRLYKLTNDSTTRHLSVEHIDEHQGYGFVASTYIDQDTTLVSVPLEKIVVGIDTDNANVPWNVQMAAQLLEMLYSGTAEAWMDALPGHVDLPFLYWSADEVAQLADENIIGEIEALAAFVRSDGVRDYLSGYDWKDVLWAFSMVHSRSFLYEQGQHLFAPMIDLANHDSDPNATVRLLFSVDRCQGLQALEEIAPPRPSVSTGDRSVFELVTTSYVQPGEQVCISYGAQPNDVLLLYFGFCLPDNPHDAVTFTDRDVADVVAGATGDVADRFFVSREGMDPRLSARLPSEASFAELCRRKLDHLRAIDDSFKATAPTASTASTASTQRAQTAALYRANKIGLLETVMSLLSV